MSVEVSFASSQSSLCIGGTVLFLVSSRDRNGYIYSELTSSSYNFLTVFPIRQGSEVEPNFPNIAYATFRVLAPNKYKAKQHLERVKNQIALTGTQRNTSIEEVQPYYDQLPHAKKAAEAEENENAQEQERRFGAKVLYGDFIQLQHIASEKYVTVQSEASKTESNNLLVNLFDNNSDGCIFKILPRYKVRSEGDEIRFGDQMKLESVKTQGQFLHCSAGHHALGNSGFHTNPNFFELNLSATESALTLIPHYCHSPSTKHSEKALRAGDCIRLFHREDECYIVAEGSFAEQKPIHEDIHCRQRRMDQRKRSHPSTSANTYWQIEKEEDPRTGEVLSWGERCRIKHLPTRLYLAVCMTDSDTWQVTLKAKTPDESDLDTLFSFHPLIEEGIEVLLESYARIQHLLSKQWLHLEKKEYVRKSFDPNAEGLAGLQWDSAELYMLSTSKDMGDYDAFTLQEVSHDLLKRFNYVAGIVPILSCHIDFIHTARGALTQKQTNHVTEALKELGDWMVTDNDRDTKNNQKLLRNLRVLEQLTEILKSSQELVSSYFHTEIARECYNVIKKYLEGDSRKNENYLARFIEFFQTQVRKGLNAEEVLVEIVQDNLTIVTRMANTRMGDMIKQFRTTKDPRFLHFLSSLCVCSGRPIPSTQNRLLNDLVLRYGRELFLKTSLRKNSSGQNEVFYFRPGSVDPINIHSLKCPTNNTGIHHQHHTDVAEKDFEVLEAQLHLFGRLCKGNNKGCINFLVHPSNRDGYISFDEALLCAQDTKLDTTLRSRYVELLLVMFVDVGENRPFLDHLCYSFIYQDLIADPYSDTGDDETVALTGVENVHFPELKTWLLNVVKSSKVLYCDDAHSEDNELLAQMLDVLGHLVRYGYYDSEDDIDEIVTPLIELLNGETDLPRDSKNKDDMEEFQLTGRKEDNLGNRAVFAVKRKSLEVMELFFRFKFYVKLQKFIFDFKVLDGAGRMSVGKVSQKSTAHSPPSNLRTLKAFINPDLCQDWLYSEDMIRTVRDRLQYLCDGAIKGINGEDNPLLEHVLIDLSTYDCDELVTSSLDLLTQMYFFEEELFNKAQQSQLIISEKSIDDYEKVNSDILPELRQLLRVDPNQNDQERMIELLDQLCKLCVLSTDTDEPNKQNQIMLNNFGVLDDILSYVLSKGDQGTQLLPGSEVTVQLEVFQKCFCLLRFLTADLKNIQQRLFNRINDFLAIKVPTIALADLADLLTEVFTGGPELILKVSEVHLERIFEIIIDCKNHTVQAQFMVTLEAIAKIEELSLPVKRNQALIVKNFCRCRDRFCQDILGEKKSIEEKRMNILQMPDCSPPDPQLQLLLSVTDMLAACAEGKNIFIESVCQNIFSVEELINIMSSELPPMRKRPFVRFLIGVYMYTERDKQSSSVATISHGGVMWSYLEHVAELLKDIAIAVHSILSEDVKPFCQELKSLSTGRKRALTQVGKRPLPRTKSKRALPSVTGDDGYLKPGLIEYLIEGVLPLLHIFYSSHFDPLSIPNEEQRKMEYDVSAQIAKNLITLKNELSKYFSSQQSIVMFQETILSLSSHEEIQRIANLDKKVDTTSILSTDSVDRIRVNQHRHSKHRRHQDPIQSISLKPISYTEVLREESEVLDTVGDLELQPSREVVEYKDQEKINDSFHTFARNYQLVYIGSNTATHQIGSSVSEDIEYSEEGEELPLGPNFQQLVKLYYSNELPVREEAEMLLKQLEISTSQTEQLNETEQISQDILDIRCLQVLRALIHNRIKLIDPELKDRDPTKYRSKSDVLYVPVQNAIQTFRGNAIQKVIPLLCHPNESISREALALMKALLFSGNEEVQEGLAINVQETREETLFLILKKRLETASLNYKETCDLQLLLSTRQDYQLTSLKSRPEDSLTRSAKYDSAIELNRSGQVRFLREQSVDIAITLEPLDESSQATSRLRPDSSEQPKGKASSEQLLLSSQILANDTNWTSLVLEVIGLMCDGQHRTLQNYLRVQPDNFKTVNVVAEVTAFLHTYTSDIGRDNMGQIHQILQSLIEMCVGNVHNQQVIYDKLVIEPLNRLLQLSWEDLCSHNHNDHIQQQQCHQCSYLLDLVQVKGSAVELIDAMLEETNPQTSVIAQGIGSSLDMESVIDTKKFFYILQSHPLIIRKQMDDDCQRGMFRAYHIVISLMEYHTISLKNQDDLKDEADIHKAKDAYNECTKYSRTIEIHYEEGSKPMLARVHFPYNPDDKLREEITEVVRWNINRDSMEDKQRALLDLMPALKRDVLHQMKLRELKFLKPVLIFHTFRYRLLIFLTLLLNLFILFLGNVPTNPNDIIVPDFPIWFKPYILYILGTVHLLLSIWVVVEYFIINWPHFKLPRFCYSIWKSIRKVLHRRRNSSEYSIPQSTCLDVGIFGVTTVYMIVFLLSSILSLAFSGYFYCICLLFVIYNNDILQRVLKAITKNGISLIWVAILGLIFLFIYAVISFAFLHNYFIVTDDASLYCDTLSQCMYSVLRYGLIDNIGLLVPLNSNGTAVSAFSAGLQIPRLLFDLSFFIIIITIGLNIVFGIIVDTFSELREERGNVEADQKSTCFICDLPSHQFERKAKGFRSHVKHDHNMWNYVYYSLYLDNIDTGDHNAIQKYVYELIEEKNTSFFPQEEARCLFEEEDATGLLIEELMNKMDYIVQHFRDKEHTKSVTAKKEKQKKWEEEVLKNRQESFGRGFSLDSDKL